MRIRLTATTATALLLAGVAAFNAFVGAGASRLQAPFSAGTSGNSPAALGSSARVALERCSEHVAIIHDVHWAAACEANAQEERARRSDCLRQQALDAAAPGTIPCQAKWDPPDDSPECTLPDALALPLNAARSAAESRCVDEAAAVQRMAGAPDAR